MRTTPTSSLEDQRHTVDEAAGAATTASRPAHMGTTPGFTASAPTEHAATVRHDHPPNPKPDGDATVVLELPSSTFLAVLALVVPLLAVAHLVGYAVYYTSAYVSYFETEDYLKILTVFDLNEEGNLAAWYSSFTLLLSSTLLGLIACDAVHKRDQYRLHWIVLAIIFLYLSIDETAMLHERTMRRLRNALGLGGFFYYSWVVIAIPALLVLACSYFRFLMVIQPAVRNPIVLAGVLYVAGALGVEMVEGYYHEAYGYTATYAMIVAVEETLEMLGILVFLQALFRYLRDHVCEIRLRFDRDRAGR